MREGLSSLWGHGFCVDRPLPVAHSPLWEGGGNTTAQLHAARAREQQVEGRLRFKLLLSTERSKKACVPAEHWYLMFLWKNSDSSRPDEKSHGLPPISELNPPCDEDSF